MIIFALYFKVCDSGNNKIIILVNCMAVFKQTLSLENEYFLANIFTFI